MVILKKLALPPFSIVPELSPFGLARFNADLSYFFLFSLRVDCLDALSFCSWSGESLVAGEALIWRLESMDVISSDCSLDWTTRGNVMVGPGTSMGARLLFPLPP